MPEALLSTKDVYECMDKNLTSNNLYKVTRLFIRK